ncbi:MAG: universal stress protein [Alphaproteobacteria bacterium]|nr:universal stress protein [Alphaproteobacteria bacterium]MDX5414837.1 universal stress protein [Alphaproteobacteria bacterium]MDX5492023.1 universal stress protein [Alphaproteobacteria bacterium]
MSATAADSSLSGLKSILVATDLSSRSDKAVARGLSLAARFGARVKVVHVVDDDQPQALVDLEVARTAELLEESVRPFASRFSITPEIEIAKGIESEAIRAVADVMNADLLVLGAHRRQFLRDVFTGTTVERVIRTSGRPVLMVRLDSKLSYETAVAAVDLSRSSLDALEFASSASFLGCTSLILLHAYMPLASGFMRYASVGEEQIEDYSRSLANEALSALEGVANTTPLAGLSPELLVEEGGAVEVIGEVIASRSPQLVVMGTAGNSMLKNVLIGSVANAILRDAECDVLAYAGRPQAG